MLLHALSRASSNQWSWQLTRQLATHVVISAEAAKAVAQHGAGLVKLPADMVQTLEGYFQDAGLTGKHAKLRATALTDQLKALSRSKAVGGLQPYRTPGTSGREQAGLTVSSNVMTPDQLQEQREMDADMEKMAASLGPEVLHNYRKMREAAAAAAELPLPRTKGGRLKAWAKSALEEHIAAHGVLGLPHEAVRAALDLPPSSTLNNPHRSAALKKATPSYHETQALAYALSRLPGCFAAASRIFKELGVRLPGFEPKTLLDFGAGPGTASWAAQEVWPSSLSRLTAVEPSNAMMQLGMRLEAARRFAHPSAPLVRWRSELPPLALSSRKKQQQQRYDLVVASYVLGEVESTQEREALVRQLWSLTGDMLVLLEPGTPAGSANIQEARAAILAYEARRVDKLQRRMQPLPYNTPNSGIAAGGDSSSSSGDGDGGVSGTKQHLADHNLPAKAHSKWFGAHVVAPCPHDGPCPLAAPGSKSWCHFGTRFQRPGFMQEAKAPKGLRVNPADHQDERYSYTVLRRGTRPASVPEVDISRTFAAKQPANLAPTAISTSDNSSSSDDDSTQVHDTFSAHSMYHAGEQADSGSFSIDLDAVSLTDTAAASGATEHDAVPASAQAATAAAPRQPLFSMDDLQELSAALVPNRTGQQKQHPVGSTATPSSAAVDAASAQVEVPDDPGGAGEHFARVNSKMQLYGEGLINRLIALEDAGVDWSGSGAISLTPELAALAAESAQAEHHHKQQTQPSGAGSESSSITSSTVNPSRTASGIGSSLCGTSGRDISLDGGSAEHADDFGTSSAGLDQRVLPQQHSDEAAGLDAGQPDLAHEQQLDLAALSSAAWSRVIRPPRIRGGHVILDLCSSNASMVQAYSDEHQGEPCGKQDSAPHIVRHVIAKSDSSKWMGRAAYQLAHSAQWGDLWPSFYNGNSKQQVVK